MLNELTEVQESDEETYGQPRLSLEFDTREEDGGKIYQRRYVFSYAPEWDEWQFSEFEERRTKDTLKVTNRNWKRTKHITWDDAHRLAEIQIPPEVSEELERVLGFEKVEVVSP